MKSNPWKTLLAYTTGQIEADLLARIEYLQEENRILRSQLDGRPRLNDAERISLAEKALAMPKQIRDATVSIVKPDTILKWHRELVRRKWDYSERPRKPGRPRVSSEIEKLIVNLARANPGWGYDRLKDAINNLGYRVSDSTVANILKRNGLGPSRHRIKGLTWAEFIRQHRDVMWATDFFTSEVWTATGLTTIYVLFFIHIETRKVVIGGMTAYPDEEWMKQIARNVTSCDGELEHAQYLIHDRDGKYTEGFDELFQTDNCESLKLPPRSPNLNAHAERWIRSIRQECLDHLILFGETQLRYAINEYIKHYHTERNHQGKQHQILSPDGRLNNTGTITVEERLGGMLNFYYREAA